MREAAAIRDEPNPLRRFLNPQDSCWHVQITQGETYVTGDDREVLTTVLGSCIAACIRDPMAGIGGMNHFLLASGNGDDRAAARYGVNAMELLINSILKRGGMRNRLEAKLFGGAKVLAGLSDVGSHNAAFAEKFLADEGICVVGGDLRGTMARRVQYWPVNGRARQLAVPEVNKMKLLQQELIVAEEGLKSKTQDMCDVELF